MVNRSYANRGMAFEAYIKFANDRYRQRKIASIEKLATEFIPLWDPKTKRIKGAKVEHKSKVDFLGRYRNIPIAFEAKNTFDDNIRFDRVEPHQADYMDEFTEEPGVIGMVVVSFNLTKFYAIPWAFWQAAYNARVRPGATRTTPVTVEAFGQTWEVPCKYSVRMDELNPLWEIPGNHPDYGIHYLANATSYITPPRK